MHRLVVSKCFGLCLLATTFAAAETARRKIIRPASGLLRRILKKVPACNGTCSRDGRLGCNGRACHGSFQGQGGFRLSLFGYDFKTDFDAIVKSEQPRVDLKKPAESMILAKPASDVEDEHGGGKRMDKSSWQYRLISRWVEAGAPAVDEAKDAHFVRMEVTPTEIVYTKPGETTQLKVLSYWSDGSVEDVTLTRSRRVTTPWRGRPQRQNHGRRQGRYPRRRLLRQRRRSGRGSDAGKRSGHSEVSGNRDEDDVDELVINKLKKLGVVAADVTDSNSFVGHARRHRPVADGRRSADVRRRPKPRQTR
jgi:hypothetical protein